MNIKGEFTATPVYKAGSFKVKVETASFKIE